jgi:hypothetical protein
MDGKTNNSVRPKGVHQSFYFFRSFWTILATVPGEILNEYISELGCRCGVLWTTVFKRLVDHITLCGHEA